MFFTTRTAADDDLRVLQADEGDEQADAHADGLFQVEGDGVEDSLPDIEQGQKDEDQPLCQDGCQSHLPGIAHAQDYRIGKVGV